ncbi:MAG: response regulator transcription factor [Vicinamibacterales bacterium]
MPIRRVFLVDDSRSHDSLRQHLTCAGYGVEHSADGREALPRVRRIPFDLILLDVMVPGVDGFTLCRAIREAGANTDTPIVIITARDAEADKVLGLDSGADDYVTKPFGIRELTARIGAVMRRHPRPRHAPPVAALAFADLELDSDRRRVLVRGDSVHTTRQEFDLLFHLASHPETTFSRAALLHKVWHDDDGLTERTVDTVISRLRRKVERNPQAPELIVTAWGVGYRLAAQA